MIVRESFVESAGHRLACLVVNEHLAKDDEPAIVFIHGVLASVNFWLDCVPASFRYDRAWYSLSLPAHFPSTVPADFSAQQVDADWFFRVMNGALKALLGDRKAIVIGHSTGGFSALNLAIHQAPNVAGIISIAGFHSGQWGGLEGRLVTLAGQGWWGKLLFTASIVVAQKSPLVRRVFATMLAYQRRTFWGSRRSQRMLSNIEDHVRRQDPNALHALFGGIGALEIADQLHRITVPCHLLVGTHDPVVPASQSLVLAGKIKHANTVVFRQTGHMLFMEAFDAYADALERGIQDIIGQYQSARRTHPKQVSKHALSAV